MKQKISYDDYLKMMRDPEIEDEIILEYMNVVSGEGGFDFEVEPNPDKVDLSPEDVEFENAMNVGNGFARLRRRLQFLRRKNNGSTLPVIVSEGDSWFQFPFLVKDIIDQLKDHYLIWSIGAAGDTALNMVKNSLGRGKTEYLNELLKKRDEVQGFLFSGAGNDIIGQNPETNEPVLLELLRDFNGNYHNINGHINHQILDEKLDFLGEVYQQLINTIRATSEFENLPIFIHGYDYPFPYPWGDNDPRNPVHAAKDEWLGKPFAQRNIMDQNLRRKIIKHLIDSLYERLKNVAGNSQTTGVWLIDCRGSMPNVEDWIDEIHGTSKGFEKVASRFISIMGQVV